MKFKVGDKVKVVRKYEKYGLGWNSEMSGCIGKDFTIKKVTGGGNYLLDSSDYIFPPESLELVPSTTIDEIKQKIAKLQDAVKRLEEAKEEDNSVVVDEKFMERSLLIRGEGKYQDRSIFIDDFSYDWRLEKDACGILCLIPTKKGDTK